MDQNLRVFPPSVSGHVATITYQPEPGSNRCLSLQYGMAVVLSTCFLIHDGIQQDLPSLCRLPLPSHGCFRDELASTLRVLRCLSQKSSMCRCNPTSCCLGLALSRARQAFEKLRAVYCHSVLKPVHSTVLVPLRSGGACRSNCGF